MSDMAGNRPTLDFDRIRQWSGALASLVAFSATCIAVYPQFHKDPPAPHAVLKNLHFQERMTLAQYLTTPPYNVSADDDHANAAAFHGGELAQRGRVFMYDLDILEGGKFELLGIVRDRAGNRLLEKAVRSVVGDPWTRVAGADSMWVPDDPRAAEVVLLLQPTFAPSEAIARCVAGMARERAVCLP